MNMTWSKGAVPPRDKVTPSADPSDSSIDNNQALYFDVQLLDVKKAKEVETK